MSGPILTPDEIEEIAWQHGGTVERNVETGELTLVTTIAGSVVRFWAHPAKASA